MNENSFLHNLKNLLEVPSYFRQEHKMIEYIETLLSEIPDISYHHDQYGNIYVTKGSADFYPLVCAHTDTVHRIENYTIEEFKTYEGLPALRGVKEIILPGKNKPRKVGSGCGGDNKTGVMICIELLKSQEILKAAFFFGEETGCNGSKLADPTFFTNVGYCLEFDAPEDFWVSHICYGQKLFDDNGEFWKTAKPIMDIFTNLKPDPYNNTHPYTDVYALKALYDFSCLNFSSGYYHMHTSDEYVVIADVIKALDTAKELLQALGNTKYQYLNGCDKGSNFDVYYKHHYIKFNDVIESEV